MKSKVKLNLKRILAIFCILTIMQSYFYALKNIALAVENEVEENESGTMSITGTTNETEETQENVTEEVSEEVTEEIVEESSEETTEEITEESTETEEENLEEVEEENEEIEEEEETGNPQVGVEMSSKNSSIYKGYLYANVTSDLKYDTSYNTMVTLDMIDSDYIDEVLFIGTDKIGLDEDVELNLNDYIYYESTKVSQEEFETILGTEGVIRLYSEDGIYIGEITSESTVENGYYVYNYTENYNKVIVQIVNPINDGSITISNDKAITGDLIYTREQISLFKSINTYLTVSMISGESIGSVEETSSINLEETESKMTIEIDNNTLSTESENEISLNVALKTDEEKYDLFENPVVEIEFPSAVRTVEIEGINLLYKNGLSLNTWNTYTNESGNIVLRIEMSGSQSVYTPGSATEGTNIVIDATVTTHRLTSNGTQSLKLTYTNDATDRISYLLEGNDAEYLELNFTGKEEVITALSVTNQTNGSSAVTYDGETAVIDIEAEGENQIINVTGTMLDNFSSSITDVYIIGKIPFSGNVNVEGYNYGTTFDAYFASIIETNGLEAVVYYSEEENPDVNSESWTTDTTDVTKYKTFKIVISSEELNAGDYLSFSYSINVPENIGYNMTGFGEYSVYYTMGESAFYTSIASELVSEEKELTIEDLPEENVIAVTSEYASTEEEQIEQEQTEEENENNQSEETEKNNNEETSEEIEETEEDAILKVGTKVTYGGIELLSEDTVYERSILEYTVVVENVSNETLNNVVIKCNAENANMYYYKVWLEEDYEGEDEYWLAQWTEDVDGEKQYEEFNIETLKPGESATMSYQIVVKEDVSEVYGNIIIASDEISETTIKSSANQVVDGKIEILTTYKGTEAADGQDKISKGTFNFKVYVKNIYNETLKDVVITVNIPDTIDFNEDTYIWGTDGLETSVESTTTGKVVKIYISEMEAGYENTFFFDASASTFDLSKDSEAVKILSTAEIDNEVYYSNVYSATINQNQTSNEYSWSSDLDKETVENGDTLTYTFTIKNTGTVDMSYVQILDVLPKGVVVQKILVNGSEVEYNTGTEVSEKITYNKLTYSFSVGSGEEITVQIVTTIDDSEYVTDQSTIDNKLTVDGGGAFDEFNTEVISYNINNSNVSTSYTEEDDEENDEDDYDRIDYNEDETITYYNTEIETSILTASSSSGNSGSTSSTNSESQSTITETETEQLTSTTVATYSISGKVWLDVNKNGVNDNEEGIENVNIGLYGTISDGGIDISNKYAETTTDLQGYYEFTGIKAGLYIVAFEYDTGVYYVTTYQVSTAKSTENSDATSKTLSTGNKVAVTDALEVSSLSLINIDLGLIPLDTFDLSLSKYVTNIKVTNDEGTTNYEYDNSTYSKIEIRSKYYKSTTLEITYNIVITNEGDISGYVNKITDYLPEGMELVSQEGYGWYQDESGNLYNSDLAGTEIKSGESKTVTLVVRQSLASGEAMQLVNGAEIAESTNALGLIDEDSTAGNEEKSEDDYGKNTIIVSVSTGVFKVIRNVFLIVAMLACVGMGIVFMKKDMKAKKIYK